MLYYVTRWFVKYYERPRGWLATSIGLFVVSPLNTLVKSDLDRAVKRHEDILEDYGRLGLAENLLKRRVDEWMKKRKKR